MTADSCHMQWDKMMSQKGVIDQTFNHRRTAIGILAEGSEVQTVGHVQQ